MNDYCVILKQEGLSYFLVYAESFEYLDGRLRFFIGHRIVCSIRKDYFIRLEQWDEGINEYVEISYERS